MDRRRFAQNITLLLISLFPFIDAGEALTRDDYYKYDGHLKPRGHYKLAEAISKALSNITAN